MDFILDPFGIGQKRRFGTTSIRSEVADQVSKTHIFDGTKPWFFDQIGGSLDQKKAVDWTVDWTKMFLFLTSQQLIEHLAEALK